MEGTSALGYYTYVTFLMSTIIGRMGLIPILPVNITFVNVTVMESLGVNDP